MRYEASGRFGFGVLVALLVVFGLAMAGPAALSAYAETGQQQEVSAGAAGTDLTAGSADGDAEAKAAQEKAEAAAKAKAEAERIAKMATVKDGLYNLRSVARSDYSLSVAGESVKARALVAPADRQTTNWSQKWVVVQDKKTGYYTIRNLRSRYFLTVSGKVKSGALVRQMKQSSSLRQKWQIVKKSGTYQLQSAANPKYSLALYSSKGTLVMRLQRTKAVTRQKFRLNKVYPIEGDRAYFVRTAASAKRSIAMKGASKSSGAKAVVQASSSSKAQKFRFIEAGSSYNLQNVRSCLYLGASKSSVVQTAGSKGKAKRWTVALDLASGTFSMKSASTKKFVDSTSGKLALRAKAKTNAKARAQRFVLVPTYSFTVFVDAGHGRNSSGYGVYDPGAQGNGYNEADLTRAMAERVVGYLEGTDVRAFNGSNYSVPYWQRCSKAASLGCDVVLSIHFDAGGGNSTSTMISTSASGASHTFNSIIHRKLVSSTGLRDGGTMRRSDITVVNGSLPAVLMEVCFIDNYSSLHQYLNRKESVASSIADGIVEASRSASMQR